ncbi:MAG: dethiobiotin synthase [Xanthomonadaceae bacterium]|nr:dethiobiotin synthase [Xanthomonadaceae bacterium]
MYGLFVTGTDTGVGKTLAAQGLVLALRGQGLRVAPFKPVASGCRITAEGLRNEDAEALLAAAGGGFPYELVNPFAFAPVIAPHLAARQAGRPICLDRIADAYRQLARAAEVAVVEGAGGWRVPLDERTSMAAIAQRLGLDVILVVGVRLGCLSHALLTVEAVQADGLRLAGWIANLIDPADPLAEAQVEDLRARLPAPLLGTLPWTASDRAALVAAEILGKSLASFLPKRSPEGA